MTQRQVTCASTVPDVAHDRRPDRVPCTPPSHADQVYDVERLLACKTMNGVKYYKVKWMHYPLRQSTWEIESNLPGDLIRQFHVHKTVAGKVRKFRRRIKGA